MKNCISCNGFIPDHVQKCPSCLAHPVVQNLKKAATAIGAGMISMTLMACYGAPPDPLYNYDCPKPSSNTHNSGSNPNSKAPPHDSEHEHQGNFDQ